jgi:hypothetical protein
LFGLVFCIVMYPSSIKSFFMQIMEYRIFWAHHIHKWFSDSTLFARRSLFAFHRKIVVDTLTFVVS